MKNLVITSRDGIMCKIGEKPPSKTMDVFKSVIITERFDGEKHSLCLSVADGDLNRHFVLFSNREQILLTISKLLEYINSEQCNLSLS